MSNEVRSFSQEAAVDGMQSDMDIESSYSPISGFLVRYCKGSLESTAIRCQFCDK